MIAASVAAGPTASASNIDLIATAANVCTFFVLVVIVYFIATRMPPREWWERDIRRQATDAAPDARG